MNQSVNRKKQKPNFDLHTLRLEVHKLDRQLSKWYKKIHSAANDLKRKGNEGSFYKLLT